jgi:hypothetical protein
MEHKPHQTSCPIPSGKPALSLILCSRNDQYMGNSRWRLQTALNYAAQNVHELGREDCVEMIVTDWGSEIPLRGALVLTPAAARLTSFLHVPPQIALVEQRDSPFPEVIALNAAARRANGQYVGRIDADTLVGKRFLRTFFELFDGSRQFDTPLESTLVWAGRRRIPYRFAVRCASLSQVTRFVHVFGHLLAIDSPGPAECFFDAPVGIWLLPRKCWEDCGGYDERFLYWGFMEIEMIRRLSKIYPLVHLAEHMDCDFYHLEHYHPREPRATSRRMNPKQDDGVFHPNGENWGLSQYSLKSLPYSRHSTLSDTAECEDSLSGWPAFMISVLTVGTKLVWDSLALLPSRARRFCSWFSRVWRHRATVAWATVRGRPVSSWPGVLRNLWSHRWSQQKRR